MGQMHPRTPFSSVADVSMDEPTSRAETHRRLDDLKRRACGASLFLRDQVRSSPGATIAAVAAGSFVVGSLFGSGIGRSVLLCVAGYGLSKIIGPGRAIDPTTVMREWTEPGKG